MNTTGKRPLSVTLIGALYLIAGVVGLAYHSTEFSANKPFDAQLIWILLLRLLAVVGGIFLLRGANWARWILVIWMLYHVVLSAFHPLGGLAIHALLLAVISYFLFRSSVSPYFHRDRTSTNK